MRPVSFFLRRQAKIYRSYDHGDHWLIISDTLYADHLAVHENNIFAAYNSNGGIVRSKDNGVTWDLVSDLPTSAITISPNGYVFTVSGENIFRSTDNGDSWVSISDTSLFQGARTLAFNNGVLYASTYSIVPFVLGGKISNSVQSGGVYISSDFGESWHPAGLDGKNIYAFAFDGNKVFAGGTGTIHLTMDIPGVEKGGVFMSIYGDTSWVEINDGFYENPLVEEMVNKGSNLFAIMRSQVFSFSNEQTEWSMVSEDLHYPHQLTIDSDYLYVIADYVIAYSSDTPNYRREVYRWVWKRPLSEITPPILTLAALSTPAVNAVRFGIGANETLTSAELTVNSQPVTLTKAGDLYFGTYLINSPGPLAVHASATDLSANTAVTDKNYTIIDLNKSGHFSGFTLKSSDKGYALLSLSESPQVPARWQQLSSAIEVVNTNPVSDVSVDAGYTKTSDVRDESKIGIYEYQSDHWEYVGGHGNNGKVSAVIHSGKIAVFYNPDHVSVPTEFALENNYPNPFNPTTTIRYALPFDSKVTLKVYNILGQEVRSLVNGFKPIGRYQVMWDGRNNSGSLVSSGVYLYRMEAGKFIQSKKMLLVK